MCINSRGFHKNNRAEGQRKKANSSKIKPKQLSAWQMSSKYSRARLLEEKMKLLKRKKKEDDILVDTMSKRPILPPLVTFQD